VVSSYAVDDGNRLLLFDPIAPPSEIHALAAERESAVVLTAPWPAQPVATGNHRLEQAFPRRTNRL
jgi:hypothetical protein